MRKEFCSVFSCRAYWNVKCLPTGYAFRFYVYSIISNAIVVLPVELLHAVCFSAMWFASMDYASQIAPMGLSSAFQVTDWIAFICINVYGER